MISRPGRARCWPTADLICCEDTRRTRALLSACGITAKGPHGDRLLSLHGHNEAARLDRVAAAVAGGATVAVVSDAGHARDLGPGRLAGGAARRRGRDGEHGARALRRWSARWW